MVQRDIMKALVLKEQSFQLEEVENPILQKDQALVKVHFAALNHRDQWIREGQYAKIQLPAILGSDGCGEVNAVYNDEDKHWIGKEVIINPNINWGNNPAVHPENIRSGYANTWNLSGIHCGENRQIACKNQTT